jgi:hypothetical protein
MEGLTTRFPFRDAIVKIALEKGMKNSGKGKRGTELRGITPSEFNSPSLYAWAKYGERGRNRTCDPCIKSALLYRLSYALSPNSKPGNSSSSSSLP